MPKDELEALLSEEPAAQKDATPPKPREAGTEMRADNEAKLVAQIEAENKTHPEPQTAEAPEQPMRVVGEKDGKKPFFKRPKFWLGLSALLVVAAILAWLITPSRWWLLNVVGLKTSVTVTTAVATTEGALSMLKNTTVLINGQSYQTDEQGKVSVMLSYGQLHIEATKAGYEPVIQDVTVDFDPFFYVLGGSQTDTTARNPVLLLKNVGVTAGFIVKDWLSGLPVTSGTFSVGDVVAHANSEGKVLLSLPATDAKTVVVTATFGSDYTNKQFEVTIGDLTQEVAIVPAGTHYFISKRSGQLAVYSSKLDGSELTEIVPPAAAETGDMAFSPSPDGKYGLLASTREATRDTFGSVQQKLYVIDTATKKLTPVDSALTFNLVDWSGNSLVYKAAFRTGAGLLVERLASVNAENMKQTNLTADSVYKDVRVSLTHVVYLRADGEIKTVPVAGGGEKSLGTGVERLTQINATSFAYKIAGGWHSYNVNNNQTQNIPTPASVNRSFLAARSADSQNYLVADSIDGIPTLFANAVGNGQEIKLFAGSNIAPPIRWVGNTAVYRVGTTDFAVSPRGGLPKKITDVSPNSTYVYPSFN